MDAAVVCLAFRLGGGEAPNADVPESLILRRSAGASKDEAGVPPLDACKKQRRGGSFEAPASGLRASG